MKKTIMNTIKKVVAGLLCAGMLIGGMGATQTLEVHAAANEFISNAPTMGTGFIDISNKHLYYDANGNLCAEFYVYNGLPYTIYEISNLHLTVSNQQQVVADKTFGTMTCNLAPGTYGVFTTVFDGPQDHVTGAYLAGWMSVQNTCNYRY